MFLKMNIWDILDEYGIFMFWGAVFVCLLINKSTRKIACKILCGIFLFVFTIIAVLLVCIWIFGADNGFAIGVLVLFNLIISVLTYMSASELYRVIRLHKKGIRTYGTFIRRTARRGSVIVYWVDRRKYECITDSLEKYKIDCDKVPILYDAENLKNSCVEKHDFIPAIALIIASIILETGMIAITIYMCRYIFP
ncbi:MAG: hypothetical protein K2K91_00550 [Ruminococcus sp.]|nr:hypothetical protein [Ruminococcus sp.]